MLIENHEDLMDYLREEKDTKPKPEKQRAEEFVKEFNKEAKKQNSEWFAKWEEHESMVDKEKFILLHIHKKVRFMEGWWIFKNITTSTISLHVGSQSYIYYSFVNNDYSFSKYGDEQNDEIFKYLPELRPIFREFHLVFNILPRDKIHNFEVDFARVEKGVRELEEKIK